MVLVSVATTITSGPISNAHMHGLSDNIVDEFKFFGLYKFAHTVGTYLVLTLLENTSCTEIDCDRTAVEDGFVS